MHFVDALPVWSRIVRLIGASLALALLLCVAGYAAPARAAPMSFQAFTGSPGCYGCLLIYADGEITTETPRRFREFIEGNSISFERTTTVVLNSPGGSLASGLELGSLIRQNGLATHISLASRSDTGSLRLAGGGSCASACAYAFLGGLRRSIGPNARYGVHQVSTFAEINVQLSTAVGATQDLIASLSDYVMRMGASADLVRLATQTGPSGMRWIESAELSTLRIVNSIGLNVQEDWRIYSSPREWNVDKILPNGQRLSFRIDCHLYIPNYNNEVNMAFYRNIILPPNHPAVTTYRHGRLAIQIRSYSGSVFDVISARSADYNFSSNRPTIYFTIPADRLAEIVARRGTLRLIMETEPVVSEAMGGIEHEIPLNGLPAALQTCLRQ